jgi:hypothetical protein
MEWIFAVMKSKRCPMHEMSNKKCYDTVTDESNRRFDQIVEL